MIGYPKSGQQLSSIESDARQCSTGRPSVVWEKRVLMGLATQPLSSVRIGTRAAPADSENEWTVLKTAVPTR